MPSAAAGEGRVAARKAKRRESRQRGVRPAGESKSSIDDGNLLDLTSEAELEGARKVPSKKYAENGWKSKCCCFPFKTTSDICCAPALDIFLVDHWQRNSIDS